MRVSRLSSHIRASLSLIAQEFRHCPASSLAQPSTPIARTITVPDTGRVPVIPYMRVISRVEVMTAASSSIMMQM